MKTVSNLNIFKIGIGPSSSHTQGPLTIGQEFCKLIDSRLDLIEKVTITLFGSLSLTGKGHLTDKAIVWGLSNVKTECLSDKIQKDISSLVQKDGILRLCGKKDIRFDVQKDIIYSDEFKKMHPNALNIEVFDKNNKIILGKIYYSIGGGYIADEQELLKIKHGKQTAERNYNLKVDSATDALKICKEKDINLSQLSMEYELQFHTSKEIYDYCIKIWEIMQNVYKSGISPVQDLLPGQLKLKRRAKGLHSRLQMTTDPLGILDYISLYAIAIAEENASGHVVIAAPTNGACAVIPAVMLYLKNHTVGFSDEKVVDFLLTAMLIGSFYKKNASISGAEAGCQAEIGSASSMAAASMSTVLGAKASIACNAAEIAMEHHLGLTCDPVAGLVQIPCIERNAFGAIKAISATRMAMSRKSIPAVTLDDIIKTMYETGKDMNKKYKETSLGGLAETLSSVC